MYLPSAQSQKRRTHKNFRDENKISIQLGTEINPKNQFSRKNFLKALTGAG
jgi:hypothetical protein